MAKRPHKKVDESSVLQIDEHNLEVEWVRQAGLYYRYAEEAAQARRQFDEAKAEQDVTKAELDQAIRSDPEEYGLERVTEAAISAAIPQQSSYQRCVEEVNGAQHAMRIADAMCRALEHKKAALTKLVDLHLASYYAEPPKPDDPDGVMEERATKSIRTRGQRRVAKSNSRKR